MPQMNFAKSLANTDVDWNPCAGWHYEYLPWPAHVRIMAAVIAPTALGDVTLQVMSGSETIQTKSPVSSGPPARATAASQMPTELDVVPIDFQAPAGDRLQLQFNSKDGTARQVTGTVILTPLR